MLGPPLYSVLKQTVLVNSVIYAIGNHVLDFSHFGRHAALMQ